MSFDFGSVTTPFRMQPGLRRLPPGARQLTPNLVGARHLTEKLAVLSQAWPTALLAEPGFDAGPALDALCAHAATAHPDAFVQARGRLLAHHLGWSLAGEEPVSHRDAAPAIGACLAALPAAWRRAALLGLAFAEDFAIVDGASGRIPWLAVCLPSHWVPADKAGRHFAEVHAPVADSRQLIDAGAHLLRLVTAGDAWERFVWTITPNGCLDGHPLRTAASWPATGDADHFARHAFWRTERQTFIAVPGRAQAVFTIHVESRPLEEAVDTPEAAHALHASLASMSPAVLAYRGLATAQAPLLAWLRRRADRPAA